MIPRAKLSVMFSALWKSRIVHKVFNCPSKVVYLRSPFTSGTTLKETPFVDVIQSDFILSNLTLEKIGLEPYPNNELKSLEKADVFKLSKGENAIEAIRVRHPLVPGEVNPTEIYVRSFYDDLFKVIWKEGRAVLIGNPGVSKSWFQWYVMWRLVNHKNFGHENGKSESVKVIVRQTGNDVVHFYFPFHDKVFATSAHSINVRAIVASMLRFMDPDNSLYLFEPVESLTEPVYYSNFAIRTIATCSPNPVRYKEFCKNGAVKLYMPCWTLEELKSLGSYIYKDDKMINTIEDGYNRFGGIIRYVLPKSEAFLRTVMKAQDTAIDRTKAVDIFAPYANIEKMDDGGTNISHFILQYDVLKQPGNKYNFHTFKMKIASEYVKFRLNWSDLTTQNLHTCILNLQSMLHFGRPKEPLLFQIVIYNALVKNMFQWEVFNNRKWVSHRWELSKNMKIKAENIKLEQLEPDVLYYSESHNFPAVDMFFVKEREVDKKMVFGIQVTFAKEHRITKGAYEQLYKLFELDPQVDAMTIYIVSSSENAESYAKKETSSFYQQVRSIEPLPKLDFVAVKTDFELS